MEHQNKPVVWVGHYLNPVAISAYAFTSAEDMPDRDPKVWKLEGSIDGQTWVMLDTHATSRPIRSGTNARFTPLIMTRSFCTIGSRSPTFARPRIFNWPKSNWGVKGMSDSGSSGCDDKLRAGTGYQPSHPHRRVRAKRNPFAAQYFASHAANVMVLHLTADKPGGHRVIRSPTRTMEKSPAGQSIDRSRITGWISNVAWMDGREQQGKVRYCTGLRILGAGFYDGGTVEASNGRINSFRCQQPDHLSTRARTMGPFEPSIRGEILHVLHYPAT